MSGCQTADLERDDAFTAVSVSDGSADNQRGHDVSLRDVMLINALLNRIRLIPALICQTH